ncbi:MAG: hypothetical protein NTV60_01030 [Candidatus Kaiserbacteria bacterium]|nr:hypothetical protein [Candidatus Kaiserbacteria bacterium]
MNTNEITTSRVTVALAVVGFIALTGGSLWLAAYSTKFVPEIVGRIGSAAVYLGSVFVPSPEPVLTVVPAPIAATTIPFEDVATTTPATSTPPVKPVIPAPKPIVPTPGPAASSTYPITNPTTPTPTGLPDFIVIIKNVGYLATSSADSFIASSTVPSGSRPAVSFSIKNVGTNVSGPWRFSASIPTQSSYIFQSQSQQALGPGDSIDYTLGFDQANKGANQMISITANFDHTVAESNPNNNSASTKITILGN